MPEVAGELVVSHLPQNSLEGGHKALRFAERRLVQELPSAHQPQRSRKITERCTMKLITVAVPCAITKATGTAQVR